MKKTLIAVIASVLLVACGEDKELSCINPQALNEISTYYKNTTDNLIELSGGQEFANQIVELGIHSIRRYARDANLEIPEAIPSYKSLKYSVVNIREVNKGEGFVSCVGDVKSQYSRWDSSVPVEFKIERYLDSKKLAVRYTPNNMERVGSLLVPLMLINRN